MTNVARCHQACGGLDCSEEDLFMNHAPAAQAPVTHDSAVASLRERKKLKTRDALREAAIDLFRTRGYDATTVDDIAASIDVSKRTFFRYFEGKEDVLLSVLRAVADQILIEVARRPADEPPLQVLREAGRLALLDAADTLPSHQGTSVYVTVLQLIESTPALFAAHLRVLLDQMDTAAQILADREGVDVAQDPRPRLLVALHSSALTTAGRAWQEQGSKDVPTLLRIIDAHLDAIASAVTGHWS
jgi:AcrR family transcriptional regulator